MGENGSIWLPDAASTIAADVDPLFWFVLWTSTIIFAFVIVAGFIFALRYRRRDHTYVPEPAHEHRLLELSWIVVPAILVMTVFVWGVNVFIDQNNAPPDSYQVTVRGQQWAWVFEYPNGVLTTNEVVVPVGRPIKFNMSSSDVIHSFFVPAFRIKMDVIPNRYTSVWFEATNTGEYQAYCTEYCGTAHSGMLATVRVISEGEFQTWLQEQNQDLPPEELGQQTFQGQCAVCHATNGERLVGPPLNGLFGSERTFADGSTQTADENYLRESIVNPMARIVEGYPPAMPAAFGALPDRQIDGLIAYIKSLE